MIKKHLAGVLQVAVALWLCAFVPARGTSTASNEIVVTAARETVERWETPSHVRVISGDELRGYPSSSLPDALERVAGVNVSSVAGNPATAEVSMRGFGENGHGRVLVLVDGVRWNRPDMASVNWLALPAGGVDRVEVVHGAESALYGDHAVGGVINIVTRRPGERPGLELDMQAGSHGLASARAAYSGVAGDFGWSVNGMWYSSEGWRDRTACESAAGGAGAAFDFSDFVQSEARAWISREEYEIPGPLTLEQAAEDPRKAGSPDDSASANYCSADGVLRVELADGTRLDVGVGAGRKDMENDMASWLSFADIRQETLSLTPRLTRTVGIGVETRLLAGVDVYLDQLDVDYYGEAARSARMGGASLTRETVGGYLRGETRVSAWKVGAGGRIERAGLDADMYAPGAAGGDVTQDESAWDVSAVRQFGESARVYAKVGRVYRYPFVDEQVSYVGFGADRVYRDLKAEEGMQYEAGVEGRLGVACEASLALFQLDMKDEIAWNGVEMRNENMDRTTRRGLEADVSVRIGDCATLRAGCALMDAEFTDGPSEGADVPLAPRQKTTVELNVLLPGGMECIPSLVWVGKSRYGGDYANAAGCLDGYCVASVHVRHRPAKMKGCEVFVSAENVLDEEYSSVGYVDWQGVEYVYPAPGRIFRAGLNCRF